MRHHERRSALSDPHAARPDRLHPYSNEINNFTFITRKTFPTDQFRDALIEELIVLYEEGAVTGRFMNVGLHPHVSGRAHRIRALREFITHAQSLPHIWWPTREEMAAWYLDHHESHIPGQLELGQLELGQLESGQLESSPSGAAA